MRSHDSDTYEDDTLDGTDHNVDIDMDTAIDKELALLQKTLLSGGDVDIDTWIELANNEI